MSRASEIEQAWREELCAHCGHHKLSHDYVGRCMMKVGHRRNSFGKLMPDYCDCPMFIWPDEDIL